MRQINSRINEDTYDRIAEIADNSGVSMQRVVTAVLKKGLEVCGNKMLRTFYQQVQKTVEIEVDEFVDL